ncbi:MAG: ribonuclease P protein component, partial [Holosporaceae bacterium]|nr:ribonuclease P protein component [Holosporaceae bacterium]
MKKNLRIRKRRDFLRASGSGLFFRTANLVMQCAENDLDTPRVGFTASRRVGNAVLRNRCRRRMRAVASKILPEIGLAGVDYVLIARKSAAEAAWNVLL